MTFGHNKRKSRGMTLIEILITIGLFSLFATLLTALIVNTSRNYERGKYMQYCRERTSSILRNMRQDIGRSFLLPTVGSGYWIPSPVLLPNPYGDPDPPGDASPAVPRSLGMSTNRLVLVVSPQDVDQQQIGALVGTGSNNLILRYIEYIVPLYDQSKLLRRIYTINTPLGDRYDGFRRVSGKWMVDDSFIVGSSALLREEQELAALPGTYDNISFTVTRPQLTYKDWSYGTNYDRHFLKLKVEMERFMNDDKNKPVRYEEQTDVNIAVK